MEHPAAAARHDRRLLRRRSGLLLLGNLVVVAATASAPLHAEDLSPGRNARWATPLSHPGLRNFYRVSPILYRGAQPTAEGFRELRRLGVKTVVSLRAFHGEQRLVESAGLGYVHISFKVWHAEADDFDRFLAIVRDPARQPVFVHCLRGADRTGLAVATYRVCVEGWSNVDARDEMVGGGFGFARRFRHLERYLLGVDASRCSAPASVAADAAIR